MSTRELDSAPDIPGEQTGGPRLDELESENRRLREANRELRRANTALAREWISRRDAGAASAIHRATASERTLLRSQGWDEWPRPLRFLVSIALRARRLRERLRG